MTRFVIGPRVKGSCATLGLAHVGRIDTSWVRRPYALPSFGRRLPPTVAVVLPVVGAVIAGQAAALEAGARVKPMPARVLLGVEATTLATGTLAGVKLRTILHAQPSAVIADAPEAPGQGPTEEPLEVPEGLEPAIAATGVAGPLRTMEATQTTVRHAHVQAAPLPLGLLRGPTVPLRQAAGPEPQPLGVTEVEEAKVRRSAAALRAVVEERTPITEPTQVRRGPKAKASGVPSSSTWAAHAHPVTRPRTPQVAHRHVPLRRKGVDEVIFDWRWRTARKRVRPHASGQCLDR